MHMMLCMMVGPRVARRRPPPRNRPCAARASKAGLLRLSCLHEKARLQLRRRSRHAPYEVLEASAAALLDFQGKGFGIAECSHRGKEFDGVLDETIARCRTLLGIPDTHDVLFLQGGATQQFAVIPMNFLSGPADYVVSGEWSKKAADVAKGLGGDKIRVIASSEATQFDRLPAPIAPDPAAAYLHICSNETVHGNRFVDWPSHATLVVDASSEIMSRPTPSRAPASSTRAPRRTSARRAWCS
jgi:phosphoserine aminotransferase